MNGRHRTWSNIEKRYIDKDTQVLIMDDGTPVELKDDGFLCPIDGVDVEYYTGLNDKNGCEWYQGELITEGKRVFIIDWSDESLTWILRNPNIRGTLNLSDINSRLWWSIGNIHENATGDV